MALYEYFCEACQARFEQITSSTDPDAGKCPKCHGKKTRKLISAFRVGGRGDLRESTMHGCHDAHVPVGSGDGEGGGGHVHGPGCNHGSGGGDGHSH
jgi:putative FmdB family regulatory protein